MEIIKDFFCLDTEVFSEVFIPECFAATIMVLACISKDCSKLTLKVLPKHILCTGDKRWL